MWLVRCNAADVVQSVLFISIESLFFFNDPSTTEIYTLSLHDALPISNELRQHAIDFASANSEFVLQNIPPMLDRKSTRLNSSHMSISYAVFCLKKKRMSLTKLLHDSIYLSSPSW